MSQAGIAALGGSGVVIGLVPNSGTSPVYPDSSGLIDLLGTGSITAVGSTNTVTVQLTGLTNHSLLVGAGSATITNLGVATDGQIPIGSSAADPVLATLTAGTGIGVTNAAGSITINGVGGGLSWTDVTGTSQAMAINNGYTANNASLVTLTLPSTAAYGSLFAVVGKGAGGWQLAQNASQQIFYGTFSTTAGVGGYLASQNQYDVVHVLCTVADTGFTVISSIGNLTVV